MIFISSSQLAEVHLGKSLHLKTSWYIIIIIIIIIINHEKLWQNTAKECSIHICVERCIELDD